MKFHVVTTISFLFFIALSGCTTIPNLMHPSTHPMAKDQKNVSVSKNPHRHGNIQSSLEVPFNSSRGPEDAATDSIATTTSSPDTSNNPSRRVSS